MVVWEGQQGHTKTSQTGSGCLPCRCYAPSSTCLSSLPTSRTCNQRDEARTRYCGRSPPGIQFWIILSKTKFWRPRIYFHKSETAWIHFGIILFKTNFWRPRIYFHKSETAQRSLPEEASGIVYLSVDWTWICQFKNSWNIRWEDPACMKGRGRVLGEGTQNW